AGGLGLDPLDDGAEEPGAVLEAAAVTPGAIDGREELVAEVAVAVLDVDEGVARRVRLPRGADEVGDESVDLVVGQHVGGGPEAEWGVEAGVGGGDRGLNLPFVVGGGEPPGVGELEADVEVVGPAEMLLVDADEPLAELLEAGEVAVVDDELVRVGAAVRA